MCVCIYIYIYIYIYTHTHTHAHTYVLNLDQKHYPTCSRQHYQKRHIRKSNKFKRKKLCNLPYYQLLIIIHQLKFI